MSPPSWATQLAGLQIQPLLLVTLPHQLGLLPYHFSNSNRGGWGGTSQGFAAVAGAAGLGIVSSTCLLQAEAPPQGEATTQVDTVQLK